MYCGIAFYNHPYCDCFAEI